MSNIGHIRYYLHAALTTNEWEFDFITPSYNCTVHSDAYLSIALLPEICNAAVFNKNDEVLVKLTGIDNLEDLVDFVTRYVDRAWEELPSIPDAVTQAVTRLAEETQQAVSKQDLLLLSQVKIKHKAVVDMVLNCECDSLTIEARVQELGDSIEAAISSALEAAKKSQEVSKTTQAPSVKGSKKEVAVETKPEPVETDDAPPIAQRKHVKVYLVSDEADEFEIDVSGRVFDADSLDALKGVLTRKLGKVDAAELYQEVYDALYSEESQPAQDDQQDASNILDCTLPIEDRVVALRRHYDLVKLGICDREDEYDTMVSIAEALCDLEGEIDMSQPLETYISFDDQD